MRIPLSAPDISEPEVAAVAEVLRSPCLSLGSQQHRFEAAFRALTEAAHAIAVSSGTAGLHLALLALGIREGDEVIVPSFTFIAAANCIRYVGARPVFVDIDSDTLNMDPDAVERAVGPRTRAVLAVHTFGVPCDMERLQAIAQKHKLFLIEDACEAIGALYRGKPAGSFGTIAVFAFYPNKQITTGEGGMIVTHDATLAERMRTLRNQGRASTSMEHWLQHSVVGYNYRLSEIACTLGLGQLARLHEILARREAIARSYTALLHPCHELLLPALEFPGIRISWFVYVVRLAPRFTTKDRDAVIATLAASGIAVGRYFAPVHLQPAYAEFRAMELPVTASEASRTIALPFFNRISEEAMQEVASALRNAVNKLPGS